MCSNIVLCTFLLVLLNDDFSIWCVPIMAFTANMCSFFMPRIVTMSCDSLDSFCHGIVFIFGCANRESTQQSKEKFGNFCWAAMTLKALLNSATNCDSSEGFSAVAFSFWFKHACSSSRLKYVSFNCSTSFCITKESRSLFFSKKKLWALHHGTLFCSSRSSALFYLAHVLLKSIYTSYPKMRNILIFLF